MPAPQFHLTFGELVARHPDIHAEVRAAVESEPVYTHLGSIFHDLPYYGSIVGEGIRSGLAPPHPAALHPLPDHLLARGLHRA